LRVPKGRAVGISIITSYGPRAPLLKVSTTSETSEPALQHFQASPHLWVRPEMLGGAGAPIPSGAPSCTEQVLLHGRTRLRRGYLAACGLFSQRHALGGLQRCERARNSKTRTEIQAHIRRNGAANALVLGHGFIHSSQAAGGAQVQERKKNFFVLVSPKSERQPCL